MTPAQQAALEALAGRALTEAEVEQITPLVADGSTQAIADILSVGRTEVRSRIISARGIAELFPGGPVPAEVVMLKLEGARDAMLGLPDTPENAVSRVIGSLLRRQLKRLDDDGLDMGSPALRGMLDQFVTLGILTAEETAALKGMAVFPVPITHTQVGAALTGA
jgi:hypothetical protein